MTYTAMLDFISLACGGYILYTWLKLRAAGRLFPNSLLVPRDKTPRDCLDQAAYIRYISPRLLTVGLVITLTSVLGLVNSWLRFYGLWVSEGMIVVCLAALAWYAVCSRRAGRLYWQGA